MRAQGACMRTIHNLHRGLCCQRAGDTAAARSPLWLVGVHASKRRVEEPPDALSAMGARGATVEHLEPTSNHCASEAGKAAPALPDRHGQNGQRPRSTGTIPPAPGDGATCQIQVGRGRAGSGGSRQCAVYLLQSSIDTKGCLPRNSDEPGRSEGCLSR